MPSFAVVPTPSVTQEWAMELQSMKSKYVLWYVNDSQHRKCEQANWIAWISSMISCPLASWMQRRLFTHLLRMQFKRFKKGRLVDKQPWPMDGQFWYGCRHFFFPSHPLVCGFDKVVGNAFLFGIFWLLATCRLAEEKMVSEVVVGHGWPMTVFAIKVDNVKCSLLEGVLH